jgi:hypothetical protein
LTGFVEAESGFFQGEWVKGWIVEWGEEVKGIRVEG